MTYHRSWILFTCFVLLPFVYSQENIILAGNFLASYIQNNEIQHGSSIMNYNPATDSFSSFFGGGVYLSSGDYGKNEGSGGYLQNFFPTPLGIYGAGNFFYARQEGEFVYSSLVAQFDTTKNTLLGLNDGIYGADYAYVKAVSYWGEYVVFGGRFSKIESISLQQYQNGLPDVEVHNIVLMDQDKIYSALEDPGHNLSCLDGVDGLTSNGDQLFILCGQVIYSWDDTDFYRVISNPFPPSQQVVEGAFSVDELGNPFAMVTFLFYTSSGTNNNYSLLYYNATNMLSESLTPLLSIPAPRGTIIETPTAIPWNGGILISYPTGEDYNVTAFMYYNSSTGVVVKNIIPQGEFLIDNDITAGANNDIWLTYKIAYEHVYDERKGVYYYSGSHNAWYLVTLNPVGSANINCLVWDEPNQQMLVYLEDITHQDYTLSKMVRVNTESFPPSGSTLVSLIEVASIGQVLAFTTIQTDANNYDIYIGGLFDFVGTGTFAYNLAKYSNGEWEALPFATQGVGELASLNSTLFYSLHFGSERGFKLQIYSYAPDNGFEFSYVPRCVSLQNQINALYTYETLLFVGGTFSVSLLDGSISSAIIAYDTIKDTWIDVGLPAAINSPIFVESMNGFVHEGVNYILVSGTFSFSIGADQFVNMAIYNLQESTWMPVVGIPSDTKISSASLSESGTVAMTGQFGSNVNVASFQLGNSESFTPLGSLSEPLATVELNSVFYTAGYLQGTLPTNYQKVGFAFSNGGGNWTVAGQQSLLYDYFWLYPKDLFVTQTGNY